MAFSEIDTVNMDRLALLENISLRTVKKPDGNVGFRAGAVSIGITGLSPVDEKRRSFSSSPYFQRELPIPYMSPVMWGFCLRDPSHLVQRMGFELSFTGVCSFTVGIFIRPV